MIHQRTQTLSKFGKVIIFVILVMFALKPVIRVYLKSATAKYELSEATEQDENSEEETSDVEENEFISNESLFELSTSSQVKLISYFHLIKDFSNFIPGVKLPPPENSIA